MDPLLDAKRIREYLIEVADELALEGPPHDIVIVGGSLLALHGLRESTLDVDTITRLNAEVDRAARTVATRHGLTPTWLNDQAAAFTPWTWTVDDTELLLERGRLRVLGASFIDMVLMKIDAARVRSNDRDDLVKLWPHVTASPNQLLDLYRQAYPHSPHDEYLLPWLQEIEEESNGSDSPLP